MYQNTGAGVWFQFGLRTDAIDFFRTKQLVVDRQPADSTGERDENKIKWQVYNYSSAAGVGPTVARGACAHDKLITRGHVYVYVPMSGVCSAKSIFFWANRFFFGKTQAAKLLCCARMSRSLTLSYTMNCAVFRAFSATTQTDRQAFSSTPPPPRRPLFCSRHG